MVRSVAKARLLLTTKLNSTAAVGTQQAAASAIFPISWKPSASLHSAVDSTHNTAGTSCVPEGGFTAALAAAAANKNWEKGGSKQTQSNSLPNWQANLAVLAFGAAVVSANTHEVPITGRRQFILGLMQTLPASRSGSEHLPEDAELYRHETGPAWHALQDQGLQVMQNMYQTAALGVARLAAADTVLQKRLQLLPNRVVLQHDVNHICPQASMKLITEGQHGELSGGLFTKWLLGQQQYMRVQATGGSLLLCQTQEEAVETMSHELAHGIPCHSAEQGSWLLMPLLLGVARFTLGICSAWSQLAIPLLLVQLTSFGLVGVWLSQQQEYEADAIGAVISKAAGCSPESIVASMQRWHAMAVALRMMNNKTCANSASLQMQEGLAALHQLLPSTQHPPELLTPATSMLLSLWRRSSSMLPQKSKRRLLFFWRRCSMAWERASLFIEICCKIASARILIGWTASRRLKSCWQALHMNKWCQTPQRACQPSVRLGLVYTPPQACQSIMQQTDGAKLFIRKIALRPGLSCGKFDPTNPVR